MDVGPHLLPMLISAAICLGAFWLKRRLERRHDWNEADDWFDQDEHDLAYLEDQFEE